MGACSSRQGTYFVDEEADDRFTSIGFSPNMFRDFEWAAMKTFCQKRGITQTELNLLFRKHCCYKNASLKEYRVCVDLVKGLFLKENRVTMEMAGLFLPPILLKEYQGLSPAYSHQEISFARFVINSYIFCALPIPDLISMLFSTIKLTAKAKRMLPIDTPISLVLFHNVIRILSDSLAPSAAKGYILDLIARHEPHVEDEISLEKIIRLGIKYPLLFFELRRFQHKLRRTLHGDSFWTNRPYLRTRLEGLPSDAQWVPQTHEYEGAFVNEVEAARLTTAAIVTDMFYISPSWAEQGAHRNKPDKSGQNGQNGQSQRNKADKSGQNGRNGRNGRSGGVTPTRQKPSVVGSPEGQGQTKRNPKVYDFERYGGIVPVTGEARDEDGGGGGAGRGGGTGTGGKGGGSGGREGGNSTAVASTPAHQHQHQHLEGGGDSYSSAGGGPLTPTTHKPTPSNAFFGANVQGISDTYRERQRAHQPTAYERQTPLEVGAYRSIERALFRMELRLTAKHHPVLEHIDPALCVRMKGLVGYRIAKELVLESRITYLGAMPFLEVFNGLEETQYDEGKYIEDELEGARESARTQSQMAAFYTPRKTGNSSPAKRTNSWMGRTNSDSRPTFAAMVEGNAESPSQSQRQPQPESHEQVESPNNTSELASPSHIKDITFSGS
jgi:hypothetical protein